MAISPLAGKPAPHELLIDVHQLERAYYDRKPDLADPRQLVAFGTSGHRGTSLEGSFNEAHILAISQAICEFRQTRGINGPLFIGKDTHALSGPAQQTAIEVLAANGVDTYVAAHDQFTPTPVISHAILTWNAAHEGVQSDGIVITPSHNPPRDGGFKYNPPNGGPAESDITGWIQNRANELLRANNAGVQRTATPQVHEHDFISPYVNDLGAVIDMETIRGLKLGVDPLGGASLPYWEPIAATYGLNLTVVNTAVDPAFSFMTVDHDGKIRMDCSSPYAMAKLVGLRNDYQLAFGNDPDSDRHGIVTPSAGLMNPNHYLAAAIDYLLTHRPEWSETAAVGKTLVSSSLIDKVVAGRSRQLAEVPVGFKYFAEGLFDGSFCFGGEESAGASFLRRNGKVWATDKDGIIMDLLAAEMTAVTGKDPSGHFKDLTARYGMPYYSRIDAPATPEQKSKLSKLSPDAVKATALAGEPITGRLTKAPFNGAAIGGLKVTTATGWFCARPSGTENIYKIYAESFLDEAHLNRIIEEAQQIVNSSLS